MDLGLGLGILGVCTQMFPLRFVTSFAVAGFAMDLYGAEISGAVGSTAEASDESGAGSPMGLPLGKSIQGIWNRW